MKPSLLKISRFCAILVGLVLLASGLLKLLDPVGTGLIVQEYCRFLHLGFLSGIARWTGVALALLESVLGTALLTGVYRRATAVATQILLAVFTLITILLVVFKPEMDCGCFGEAVHLTHSQSLLKNLILLALVAVAFLPFKDLGEPKKRKYYAFWAVFAGLAVAAVYNQFHLPAVDFTEFAPGNELFASRDDSPEEADVFVAHVYERDAQTGLFPANRLPDSTWTFVRLDTVSRNTLRLDVRGALLSFRDAEGNYRDADAARGKVVLLSAYEPERMDWTGVPAFIESVYSAGAVPMLLVTDLSSVPAGLQDQAFAADYKTLITLNRSNGGVTYLDDGLIVRKWHARALPSEGDLSYFAGLDGIEGAVRSVNEGRLRAEGYLLYLLAVLILL